MGQPCSHADPTFCSEKEYKKKASSVVKTVTLVKNHAEDNVFSYDFEVEKIFRGSVESLRLVIVTCLELSMA